MDKLNQKMKTITITPEAMEALNTLPDFVSKAKLLHSFGIIHLPDNTSVNWVISVTHPHNRIETRSIRIIILCNQFIILASQMGEVRDTLTGHVQHISQI